METLGIFAGIFGAFIALITYYKTFYSKPSFDEERTNMLGMFKANQFICLEIQNLMQKYIDEKNGANHEFTTGITFQEYLEKFKSECENGLSNTLFEDLKNNKSYTKSNIETFLKGLEHQNNTFISLKGYVLLKI
ncbi:hypothetical protein [Flavobacterium panici]|uniref:Uncharacterized protein n=1 Tax=Flavobacterium panici TaxID=2654843 RepID=A0A9N8J6K7_9FLAO|nr:hypothetical protein [Flavobacterium panici]CAC9976957.1 hypothetical protein FLAPXU55_04688 [Flavobacterium panici]